MQLHYPCNPHSLEKLSTFLSLSSYAGFIVAPEARGQGIGRLMGEAMLELARDRGYRAVMYNLIFATNVPSLKLWESLGFQPIGQIPEAARLADGRYVDAIMLYKSLV